MELSIVIECCSKGERIKRGGGGAGGQAGGQAAAEQNEKEADPVTLQPGCRHHFQPGQMLQRVVRSRFVCLHQGGKNNADLFHFFFLFHKLPVIKSLSGASLQNSCNKLGCLHISFPRSAVFFP